MKKQYTARGNIPATISVSTSGKYHTHSRLSTAHHVSAKHASEGMFQHKVSTPRDAEYEKPQGRNDESVLDRDLRAPAHT